MLVGVIILHALYIVGMCGLLITCAIIDAPWHAWSVGVAMLLISQRTVTIRTHKDEP